MRIFKNRGDFYISKSSFSGSKQAKILFAFLAVIVVFTVAFIVLLSSKYSSAADFFGDGEVTSTTAEVVEGDENTMNLPEISGKINYLLFETDDENTKLHWLILLQADKDNLAYKVTSLPTNMKIDKDSLLDIYLQGGGAALQTRLTEYFGFEIDYYAGFETSSFIEFGSKLGTFVYSSLDEIIYSGGEGNDKYSLHINEGEQKISAKELTNLLRYYSNEKKNYALENELALRALTELLNADNFEDCDSLFKLFIKGNSTDITVRDFENGKEGIEVFSKRNGDITLYSAAPEAENRVLTQKTVKEIKGYFAK